MLEYLSEISTSVMPLLNIPLILNIRRRKCSCDISLVWAAGIWICSILLLVAGIISGGTIFKLIALVNFAIFTVTMLYILKYHHLAAFEKATESIVKLLHTYGNQAIIETSGKSGLFNLD